MWFVVLQVKCYVLKSSPELDHCMNTINYIIIIMVPASSTFVATTIGCTCL